MAPASLLLPLALLLMGSATAALGTSPARYMTAEILAESLAPAPGSTILVGLRLRPKPGWHGYWSNPGDAGFAPSIRWSAPAGVTFGPLLHPAPELISAEGIASYVHGGEHVLLSRMTIPRGLARGTPLPVAAQASWAACTATMCVPLQGTLTLDLTAGGGDRGPDWPVLAAARRKLPRPASGGSFTVDGSQVRLTLPGAVRLNPRRTRFFPDDNDAFETDRGRAALAQSAIVIAGPARKVPAGSISGVASDGESAYRLTVARQDPAIAVTQADAPARAEQADRIARRPEPVAAAAAGELETADRSGKPPQPRLAWPLLLVVALLLAGVGVALGRNARSRRP